MPEEIPIVELRNVSVHRAGRPALIGIDWALRPGEHWAFTGPNGSGKSTLLHVIRGDQWIDPGGGERVYRFEGTPRGAMAGPAFIGLVSPEQHERYVRMELPVAGRNVIESGFDDSLYVHRPPTGDEARAVDAIVARLDLAAVAEKPVRLLSFGQLRRLLIARALVRRPRVLVLDEFTNGLDARSRAEVLACVASLAGEVQLLIASHRDDDLVAAITHHARLESGRIVASGPGRPSTAARSDDGSTPAAAGIVADAGDSLIAIEHADVYRGATLVLRDLSWSLRRGQHTAISGANGSGKSTLAAVIAGTLSPAFGGEIRRSGAGGPFDLWRVKETIAHVSEEWQIGYDVNHTVDDVVASGFASSVGLFHDPDAAQRSRAADVIAALGLDALRARPFMQLSFGERRKVLIARALVRLPAVLILDEVWNGLDAAFRTRLQSLLHELAAAGTTLIVIAHHAGDEPGLIVRRQHLAGGTLRDA